MSEYITMQTFDLTPLHIHLMSRYYIDHGHSVPTINEERPWGNSDIIGDIASYLDIVDLVYPNDVDKPNPDIVALLEDIIEDMSTALEIVLQVASFEPGKYEYVSVYNWRVSGPAMIGKSGKFSAGWRKVK